MAYGFGTTFGTSATTDRIVTEASAVPPSLFTIMVWAYRAGDGPGGGLFPRAFNNGFAFELIDNVTDLVAYQFNRGRTTAGGTWTTPRPTPNAWHPWIVRYDGGSTANDPLIDYETPQTVTEAIAPAGSLNNEAARVTLGGRHDDVRAWDGMLAEYARWNRILTDGEVAALAKGYSPLFFLLGLVRYMPVIRGTTDRMAPITGTVTGALVQPHPRILYPTSGVRYRVAASAPPAELAARRTLSSLGTRTGSRQVQEV